MARKRTNIKEKYIAGSNALAYDYTGESNENIEVETMATKASIKTNSANPMYTVAMITVILLMMLVCVMMLKTQFTVAHTSEAAIELRHELTAIRRENAHLESIIQEELDLVEIKRMEIEE